MFHRLLLNVVLVSIHEVTVFVRHACDGRLFSRQAGNLCFVDDAGILL